MIERRKLSFWTRNKKKKRYPKAQGEERCSKNELRLRIQSYLSFVRLGLNPIACFRRSLGEFYIAS